MQTSEPETAAAAGPRPDSAEWLKRAKSVGEPVGTPMAKPIPPIAPTATASAWPDS